MVELVCCLWVALFYILVFDIIVSFLRFHKKSQSFLTLMEVFCFLGLNCLRLLTHKE